MKLDQRLYTVENNTVNNLLSRAKAFNNSRAPMLCTCKTMTELKLRCFGSGRAPTGRYQAAK